MKVRYGSTHAQSALSFAIGEEDFLCDGDYLCAF